MSVGQPVFYVLPSVALAAGANGAIPLKDLPGRWAGLFAHLVKFIITVEVTPTFTTAPTTVGNNNVFRQFDFWDGKINRFVGGLNHMRVKERLSAGRVRIPDADADTASGTARRIVRVLHSGPPHLAGAPGDFAIPCAMLASGELRHTQGALTDLSADTTNFTGTARVVAELQLSAELRIPPAYVFTPVAANAQDVQIPGEALYESVSLLKASPTSFAAIGAGIYGAIRLDLGNGDVIQSVQARDLSAAYQDDMAPGEVGVFNGEPLNTSDDANKIVSRASANTIANGPNDIQPVLYTPPGCKLSKLLKCEGTARLQWNGSDTAATVVVGRMLPQPMTVISGLAAQALKKLELGKPKKIEVKTLSKKPYTGPYEQFMPYVVKV